MAYKGKGTIFSIDDGAASFIALAEVRSITGPGYTSSPIDVTNQDSTNNFAEYIGGKGDAGSVSLDLNYLPDDTEHVDLVDWIVAGSINAFKISFPTSPATTVTFDGLVTAFEPSAPYDDRLSASVTIKITGVPVWA